MSDDPEQVAGEGDTITVGAINNAEGIAIGRNARVEIRRYGDVIVRVDTLEDLPPTPGKEPYKGLTYYTEDDRDIFFGRERLSDDLAARLETTAFLLVAGASGSGKSSLLRAGVIPRLRQRNWLIRVLTPSADPLRRLAENLTPAGAARNAVDGLRDELAADPQTLRHAAEQLVSHAASARLLLVVDQFEELFTQCRDEPARRAFIDNLLAAAHDDGRITVLIGLRADFTGRLAEVEALRARAESNFILLGPMQQEDLVRVIAEPARIGGWAFVDGLVEQFLRDAGQEPGRLPLLSHALLETWKRRSSHVMTLKGYREAGGVDGAIARTAEGTLERLTPQARPIAQAIFLALTELGEGAEDTRRVARRDELDRAGDPAAVDGVLNTLAAARLVMIDDKGVQVAHEALIRRWPRLREWLADSRQRLRFERQLEEDAQEWETFNRDPGALYRGARLAQAREGRAGGRKLSERGEEFLAASTAEEQREAAEREAARRQRERLTRRAFVGVSVFAALAVLAAVFAFLQRDTAIESEATAVAAQSTTAYEATRAEFNLNQAVAARATSDFNETQAEIERDNAVAALNDSSARLLLNLSQSVFEDDPLLADRLLLEAMAAGSENAVDEAAGALSANLLSGLTTTPITATNVLHFTDVHTGTVYVVDYQLENGLLISGETGVLVVPLNGDVYDVTPLPDSPFFVVDYSGGPSELRRTDDIEQALPLNGDVNYVTLLPDSPFFVVDYSDGSGELRRTDDIEQALPLNGVVFNVTPLPDSPFFVVGYSDGPHELRRTDDIEQALPLNGDVFDVIPLPDSPFFVVRYSDGPSELRLTDDIEQAIPLNGDVSDVRPLPDSPFFVVRYSDGSGELRRMDSGEVVTDEGGRRTTASAAVLRAGEDGYYFMRYQDGNGVIATADRTLIDLDQDAEQAIYFPETNRIAVRYGDGRVVYIDLNLIEAIGGPDGQATLAAMSPDELVAFACDLLFTGNPEWDEARLEEYLAFLPGGRARACGEN